MEFSKWNVPFFLPKKHLFLIYFVNWLTYVNKFILSINMLYLKISVLSAGISLALIIGFALPVLQLKKNAEKN